MDNKQRIIIQYIVTKLIDKLDDNPSRYCSGYGLTPGVLGPKELGEKLLECDPKLVIAIESFYNHIISESSDLLEEVFEKLEEINEQLNKE